MAPRATGSNGGSVVGDVSGMSDVRDGGVGLSAAVNGSAGNGIAGVVGSGSAGGNVGGNAGSVGTVAGKPRRMPIALLAWLGATAVASGVAWLGVDSVLIPAAETPPAVLAAGTLTGTSAGTTAGPVLSPAPPSATAASPSPSPAASSVPGLGHASKSPSASASASASPSPSPTSSLSRYDTAGGVVVLAISAHFVSLVSATPASGYSVQNWGAAGWLRVDFTQGSTTYSIFATWNGYSPQVQVVGPSATS